MMQGRRVEWEGQILKAGEYSKLPDGTWHAAPATDLRDEWGDALFLANLAGHDVVEHDDGTITVSPSILVKNHDGTEWHGFLERGAWRSC